MKGYTYEKGFLEVHIKIEMVKMESLYYLVKFSTEVSYI